MREIEIDGRTIEVASTVDAKGFLCPLPVVKLKLELERVELNQIVEILADDPGILKDLPAWCEETGNGLLSMKEDGRGAFVAYVEKRADRF
ncbi:MAG: sulfurtransferase TusA family protein [bacterium]